MDLQAAEITTAHEVEKETSDLRNMTEPHGESVPPPRNGSDNQKLGFIFTALKRYARR